MASWLDGIEAGIETGIETVRPGDLGEARDAVMDGRERGSALLVRGGGTKLGLGWPPERIDRVIDTTGLHRLIDHDPGDMTATVQAGMTLAALAEELARAGQRLAVDPPLGDKKSATVGGVFASNDSGPCRLGHGSLRELVIGMTVILGDGTMARSGGKVIKNVAGFDLCKLFCGSLGTLGLVAELTVRLHPIPEHVETVRVASNAGQGSELALALMASPLEPSAVVYDGDVLWIRFEGSRGRAMAESERARALVAGQGLSSDRVPEKDSQALWSEMSERLAGLPGETVVRIASLPARLEAVVQAVHDVMQASASDVTASWQSQVCLGLHVVRIVGGEAAAHAGIVRALRARIIELGGHAVVWRQGAGLDGAGSGPGEKGAIDPIDPIDPFGPLPSAFPVMRRVKERLDPGRRFAPGRFIGRL